MGSLLEQDPQIKAVYDALQADPEDALRQATDLLRSAGADRALAAKAKRATSSVYLQKGETRAAVEVADEALGAFKDLGDVAGQASALRALAEARLYEGRPELAAQPVADALQRFRDGQEVKGEAFTLLLQAEIKTAQEDYEEGAAKAAESMVAFKKLAAKDRDHAAGCFLVKLSEFYLSAWKPSEAVEAADEAVKLFRGLSGSEGKAGEGAAVHALAVAHLADQKTDAALTEVNDALGIFKSLNDRAGQGAALRTKINVFLADKKRPEARGVASEAVAMFRAAGDAKGEAGAQLLVAEVCIQTLQSSDAVSAANEALRLYQDLDSKAGQAAALAAITTADFDNEEGKAVWAATERASLFKGMGDRYQEADALLALANVHVSRIGKKIARCSLAPAEDSIAALRAAKDAHGLFGISGYPEGMENAMRAVAQVLQYNNVASDVIAAAADPEEVFQNVLSGNYSSNRNALPQRAVAKNISKIEDIVPSAKQLERGKFAWNNPLSGYSYTLIWQSAKERTIRSRKPRGSYDILAMGSGNRTTTVPTLVQARSNDASERNDPLVVYMMSTDAKNNYASSMMSAVQTIAAMITAKLPRLTFVQFDECHFDWQDTKVRQCNIYPVILGLVRSARIEAPNVTIGVVGGDAASWLADPAPMIESIFDTIETDESELIYKRGDAFAPLLVHKPMDDPVQFVKPKKKTWGNTVR